MKQKFQAAYCDASGDVYDDGAMPVFRSGRRFVAATRDMCIPLPYGSELFTLPGRAPVIPDHAGGFRELEVKGQKPWALAAFFPSAYLRTYLPAYIKRDDAPLLPLWAYAGAAFLGDKLAGPALRIDRDMRSDPKLHDNDHELRLAIKRCMHEYSTNRLVAQLARCASEYRCLCARNFFLGRFEAPVPTSPSCNARCAGCLSYQDEGSSGFCASQFRLDFLPTPDEIAQVIVHHFSHVENAVASFGQGCEGEPLLRADDLVKAVKIVRAKTSRGTIHLNTNGSLPDKLACLFDAGLDSVRISLNSPTEKYYTAYYKPVHYCYPDVLRSIRESLGKKHFVSINLFFLPGFTDAESEVAALVSFLDEHPVSMIQTRNLNIDPDFYLDTINFQDQDALGISGLITLLKEKYPQTKIGYYNPPKENFE